ncbi:U11/U12 small nuclear ribonucleoprotein 35 kDa protein-like [Polyodon spathula]|uniref:U11/U12 small nuclear ribonucleoprotein 35 kDa protein-like n=1 Tax=Polyodon spathula TaxID=7913 RepID=UPI001B7F6D8A|nr:U11/U12 small nuclear ribonucleoprotein 35 kDa protein-like [Polyodon spathula]
MTLKDSCPACEFWGFIFSWGGGGGEGVAVTLTLTASSLPLSSPSPPLSAAYKHADGKKIDGRRVLVDVERGRTVKGWQPRRLGGGLGGTRRGGADVNIKHSGRDDTSRYDERDRERGDSRQPERSLRPAFFTPPPSTPTARNRGGGVSVCSSSTLAGHSSSDLHDQHTATAFR